MVGVLISGYFIITYFILERKERINLLKFKSKNILVIVNILMILI